MANLIDNHKNLQPKTYYAEDSAVFRKTKERFGALSNMAGGFPLRVNDVDIRTSEALYQACRFPHLPEIQRKIIAERSPMTAKMIGKPHRWRSRSDWDSIRVMVMRWCLQVKLVQNWNRFQDELLETGDLEIVEQSRRDDFWGAKPIDDTRLVGVNVLGRLLTKLRDRIKDKRSDVFKSIEPLRIPDFRLYDIQIETIYKISCDSRRSIPRDSNERPLNFGAEAPTAVIPYRPASYSTVSSDPVRININTASVANLRSSLPITLKQAKKIVAYRKDMGQFLTVECVKSVRGIGEITYKKIADMITVGTCIPNTQLSFPMDSQ